MLQLRYKLWLSTDDKVFGEGPYELLCLVDRLGSLNKAAVEMDMSYSQAWRLVNMLEKRLGFKLLIRRAGGCSGGGSVLTAEARELMEKYGRFNREAGEILCDLFNKYFAPLE